MKKVYLAVFILYVVTMGATPGDPPPQATISNGLIHARLYLPDQSNGYYRGSRFDWSGVIAELTFAGHSYYGQWFNKYAPTLHDAIMGPVEDFSPVGYDEAGVGEDFLKVGIGMVTKPAEPKYTFANFYTITNPGSWQIKRSRDRVEFNHTLNSQNYSYKYTKTVQLVKGKPEMILSHTLKNTGKRTIETDVYDHNFLMIDQQTTGKDFVVKLPFQVTGEERGQGGFGRLQGNQLLFLKDLAKNDHLQYISLQGYSNSAKDYDIRIENHKTGAAVRITCDQPLAKLAFWSAYTTICPEPYINLKVEAGHQYSWKIFYEFYTCETNN
ncbi:MAG: hypothetical protein M3040_08560 [Bacteroidota bacterium]|nr:hypothetical protein [Bacteroidota bacterium]